MVDTFALIASHAMLVIVILRLLKVADPAFPPKKVAMRQSTLAKSVRLPRA